MRIEVVFDQDWHTKKLGQMLAIPDRTISRLSLLQSTRIHDGDRIDSAGLIIGRNTIEIAFDHRAAGDLPRSHRVLNIGYGRFHQREAPLLLRATRHQ